MIRLDLLLFAYQLQTYVTWEPRSSCYNCHGVTLLEEMPVCSFTHPASLLKVDQTTLRRTQRACCQTLDITYQWPLRQTALGGPLQKWTDKIPHTLMETYAPVSDSRLHRQTLRCAELCKLADTCSQISKHTHRCKQAHTYKHVYTFRQVLWIFLFLHLLSQEGQYQAWSGQLEMSPSTVLFLALLPVKKQLFDYSNI